MKLQNIINENKTWEDGQQAELLKFVKKNCQPFLKESKLMPLYRGVKGGMGLGFIKDIRTDRKTKGSSKWWQMAQYNMEKAGIKATRKNSINCSGDSEDLGMFGNVYRVFPIGKFNYSWHPKIADFNWSALSSSNATENPKYWEFVMKGYKTDDLVGGINSRNEILLSGTQYVCLKSSAEMWVGGGFVRNPDKQINRNLK